MNSSCSLPNDRDIVPVLVGISSLATRQILQELGKEFAAREKCKVEIEFIGGIEGARRVRAGERFDAVFLAYSAIDALMNSGCVVVGSRVDYAKSGVAVAVRKGATVPDISTAEGVRAAVLAAGRLGYSTGPSGVALAEMFRRWGIADEVATKVVQASPGVPVGVLLERGEIELGFQQFSELMHLEGIEVVGMLPESIQVMTIFSGALCNGAHEAHLVRRFLRFLASPASDVAKIRQGMQPV
jgi:molybdate transport system substrate-binding protein